MEAYARDGRLPIWFKDTPNKTTNGNEPKTGYPAGSVYRRLFATATDGQDD